MRDINLDIRDNLLLPERKESSDVRQSLCHLLHHTSLLLL